MLDVNLLLDETDEVAERLATKGVEPSVVFSARSAVVERREARGRVDELRAQMNRRSREVGPRIAGGGPDAEDLRQELGRLKQDVAVAEAAWRDAEQRERDLLWVLPNLPDPKCPVGSSEEDNVVLRYGGPAPVLGAVARPHWEVASELGIFDPERAAKLSGSGFSLLRGDGSRLLRALVQFGLDLHRDEYEEIGVPHFVRSHTMVGTGHLPKFQDDAYKMTLDDLWAIPTGEVPLTGLHRDETLGLADLPVKYMTYSVCFRREAGSAGKDTRGMQRLHEFHKVELVHLCRPEDLPAQFERLLANAERSLQALDLPYRVVDLCTADLTFSSARIFDLEVYSPGVDKWLEVSSVGNFTDFQGRRSNIRYRDEDGRLKYVCTLNGSAVATPRLWAAIIEHGQRSDGTVQVPEVLQPYMRTSVIEPHRRG